jgi:hypothetical protein
VTEEAASAAGFAATLLRRTAEGGLCLATLDFDHMGYFLNRHGSLALDPVVQATRKTLADHLEPVGGCLKFDASADEVHLALSEADADQMRVSLECAQRDLQHRYSFLAAGSAFDFGFTAALAMSSERSARGPIDQVRKLASAALAAIEGAKGDGGGQVVFASADGLWTPSAELARRVWQIALTNQEECPAATLTDFAAAAGAADDHVLLAITPQFGGTLLESAPPGGRILLPDGTPVGKLGFLNRVFDEHLTPDLLTGYVLGRLAAGLTTELFGPPMVRVCSSLFVSVCEASRRTLSRLAEVASDVLASVNASLAPELELSLFRAAIVPNEALRAALDLGQHVYKTPGPDFEQLDALALLDYRKAPAGVFEATLGRYCAKATAGGEAMT